MTDRLTGMRHLCMHDRAELQMSCEDTLQRLLAANEALVQLPDEAPRRKKRSRNSQETSDLSNGSAAERQPPMPSIPLDPGSRRSSPEPAGATMHPQLVLTERLP